MVSYCKQSILSQPHSRLALIRSPLDDELEIEDFAWDDTKKVCRPLTEHVTSS